MFSEVRYPQATPSYSKDTSFGGCGVLLSVKQYPSVKDNPIHYPECRGFEARLHFDGRLRETGRASSATGYTSSAAAGGGVEPVFLLEKRRESRKSEGALNFQRETLLARELPREIAQAHLHREV